MPHKVMSSAGVGAVETYAVAVKQLLQKAQEIKQDATIEPALTAADFGEQIEIFGKSEGGSVLANPQLRYAAVETALRNAFYPLLVRRHWQGT